MPSAPKPENERERQAWLEKLNILDTLEEQAYDDLTALAAHICDTPIALVSLIDRDRQWFKSHHGLDARETPRDVAFCAHAILDDKLFMVENALDDPRFHDNPLAKGEPHVEFYAGAPLILRNKIRVGTLCVIDDHPRSLTASQQDALMRLSRQVVAQLELRLKIEELEKLDQAKDEFISNVSHELRTPITAIHGALHLLSRSDLSHPDEADKNLVDVSLRNSDRLIALVNDILDIARLDSGRMSLDRKPVEALQLLTETIEINKPFVAKCQVKCKLCDLPNANVVVAADEKRIHQVLSNLISNAGKFTTPGDTIELSLNKNETHGIFSVTDHGPGIESSQWEHIFRRFHQLKSKQTADVAGTGLGLNISRRIIELHDGEIWLESEPNVKTTFYFSLPLAG